MEKSTARNLFIIGVFVIIMACIVIKCFCCCRKEKECQVVIREVDKPNRHDAPPPMYPNFAPFSFTQPPIASAGLVLIARISCFLANKIDPALHREVTTRMYSIMPQTQLEIVVPHVIGCLSCTIPGHLFVEIASQLNLGIDNIRFGQSGTQVGDARGNSSDVHRRDATSEDDRVGYARGSSSDLYRRDATAEDDKVGDVGEAAVTVHNRREATAEDDKEDDEEDEHVCVLTS